MSERGSMMPLMGGAVLMMVMMVLGVTVASSLLVERQRLYSLADGAAVYASESFDPATITKSGLMVRAPLSSSRVRASAEEFLRTVGPGVLKGVELESATTPDGGHAEVVLSSLWSAPVWSQFFPESLRISAKARAQTVVR